MLLQHKIKPASNTFRFMSYAKHSPIRALDFLANRQDNLFVYLPSSMNSSTFLPHQFEAPKRPSLVLLGTEPWRAAFEYASHKFTAAKHGVTGDGHTVVIFPGMATDGRSVAPLRKFCQSLGYQASDWGRGFNMGPQGNMDAWLADLASHTQTLLPSPGSNATLIGWSLGGIYAREVAKLIPSQVRQVITIGTPFNADADHTNVGWLFRLLTNSPSTFDAALAKHLRVPPAVPTTSIYSRADGVVAWQSCLHDGSRARVQDIEVSGSHTGMGWNPAVMEIVGDRLAQKLGQWRPYAMAK